MEIINKENPKSNSVSVIVFRYLPYWPLFLVSFLICISAAFLYLKMATPLYESQARILIQDEKKGSDESKTVESLDQISQNKIIENESEIIESRSNLKQVVTDLGLYAPVYQEEIFKNIPAYTISPIQIIAQNPDALTAVKKVKFSYDSAKHVVIINHKPFPLNTWESTEYGVLKFIHNTYYWPDVKADNLYFSLNAPRDVVESIAAGLKVTSNDKESTILDLNYTDAVPQRGKDILNEVLNVYNGNSAKDKNNLASSTLAFIDSRLATVSKSLDSIEKQAQQYKAASNATDISTQGRLYLENVSNNDQKLSDINVQTAILDQVQGYVESNNNSGVIVPSTFGINDPTLSQLIDKLYAAQLQYDNLKTTSGANNPLTNAAAEPVNKIKHDILENLKTLKNSLSASKNNLAVTNNSYSSVLGSIPEKERQLIDINRDQNTISATYNFLLQKREEAALSLASNNTDSKIIDNADYSDSPVSPKKKLVYVSALLASLLIGAGFIYTKETFNSKIMFRQEIESLTAQPIVGEIMAEHTKNTIINLPRQRTFIAEQFRKLRTTLNYLGINSNNHKKILITSAISGEGKSFVAANLALSLAISGKKTALIDFDLINPSLSNKLNLDERKGISDFMLDQAEVNEIIYPTDLHKNLSIVTSGAVHLNSSELLIGEKIQELLNYLDGAFDFVIIDTAPVTPITDAYILSPYCDATLFVIRHAFTPKIFISRIDENNKINKLTNVGIVFNGVKARGTMNSDYGYGYGYTSNPKQKRRLLN